MADKPTNVILLGTAANNQSIKASLEAEAKALEAWHGKNPYSEFLIVHGHRPDVQQAAAIGQLMGAQVLASDGSKQPGLSRIYRLATKRAREERKHKSTSTDAANKIKSAVAALHFNDDIRNKLVHDLFFLIDDAEFRSQLLSARKLLDRFAESFDGQARSSRSKELFDRKGAGTRS
ncbi:hypothetical protein EOA23_12630 [Mesorhizobium sp. M2A.F.Ca.ET.042.01.1.1]|uniref:hypothetical protein n=1 Tax=Mesorhizobium sp. M2A.F.Ca.ET.042.01.1.1 TaxID=2496745 RepID=UPI000FCB2610|nr:hypothetical protein [Mesorhizobium sp. M2A.F.Ca.ET.042.01.1.1]RUX30068.1 hypothetical protein EOA23_12630 [Mesorhizobium sp. M2A.F.Ca.ET.042.01.1.1]